MGMRVSCCLFPGYVLFLQWVLMMDDRRFSLGGWRAWAAFFCFMLFGTRLFSQVCSYEQMKAEMGDCSLPLVNLTVDVETVTSDYFVDGMMEIAVWREGEGEPAVDTTCYHCLLRVRGGWSKAYEKKSFAVKLVDGGGEKLDASVLGMREENSWILDAMTIDRIRMRNRVCFDVWNEMSRTPYQTQYGGRNGTEGRFVEVFINGDYHGLYCMTDKVNRKLLGLKKVKVDRATGDVTVRGLLYKGVSWGSGSNLMSYTVADTGSDRWNAWELEYPEDYPSADTWQPLMDLMDFCSYKTGLATFRNRYQEYFYPENLLDYVVFTLALGVGDNAYKNTFLSTVDITEGHRFLLTPWDMDMSLGGYYDGRHDESLMLLSRYNAIAPFYQLYWRKVDGFPGKERSLWEETKDGIFSVNSMRRRMDAYAEAFKRSGAWRREWEKWNNNPVPLQANLEDELDYVYGWYEKNYNGLCEQFGVASDICSLPEHRDGSMSVCTLDGRKLDVSNLHALPPGVYIVNGVKRVKR